MSNVFSDLRAKYFALSRADSAIEAPTSATEPWGAVMEIAYPQATVTTVTFADGTVSVLRSTGGGFFGGGDDLVQTAGKAFLQQAQFCQPRMTLTSDFSAPTIGHVAFFVRTDSGIYATSASEAHVRERSHPLFDLYCAGSRILHEYLRLQKQHHP